MNKIYNILKFAMRMEKDAGDFYNYYMDKVTAESTKSLFKELAEIERHHYDLLKTKADAFDVEQSPITISWVVDNDSTAKDPHILSDVSDVIGTENDDVDDLSVIRMAYLIENDFALFYKNAISIVEDIETKKFLQTLADWENAHKEMFYKRYQNLLKKNWNDISSIIFAN